MKSIELVVYADVLFLFNLGVNYILLVATAHIGGYTVRMLRLLAGSAIGALYACLMYFPGPNLLFSWFAKLLLCPVICAAAFGGPVRTLLRKSLMFLVTTTIFGGGIVLLRLLFADLGSIIGMRNGVAYMDLPFPVMGLSFAAMYLVLSLVLRRVGMRPDKRTARAELRLGSQSSAFALAYDTGNNLRDPVTGARVMVCGLDRLRVLLPRDAIMLIEAAGHDPAETMQVLSGTPYAGMFRLIPCVTATGRGMLLGFRPDSVKIDGKPEKGLVVAIARDGVSDGSGYEAVL